MRQDATITQSVSQMPTRHNHDAPAGRARRQLARLSSVRRRLRELDRVAVVPPKSVSQAVADDRLRTYVPSKPRAAASVRLARCGGRRES